MIKMAAIVCMVAPVILLIFSCIQCARYLIACSKKSIGYDTINVIKVADSTKRYKGEVNTIE